MAVIARGTGSALFRGLSSFWTRLFRDSAVYDSLYSATEVALGDVYLDLMEAVLTVSLRNTPVFSRRDWQLLLLNSQDLSFDPAIYSSATTTVLGVPLTVTALDLAPERDGVSMEVADAFNLTPAEKILYPTYGAYNAAIMSGIEAHEMTWTVVVPTGRPLAESVQALSRRLVSNKRLDQFTISKQVDLTALPLAIRLELLSLGSWNAATNSPAIPPATSLNAGNYYQVSVAGTTSVDGTASWAIGDWIVSRGDRWVKAPLAPPTFVFKYGDITSNPVTLPPGAYGSAQGVATALQTAIATANGLTTTPVNLTVSVDGGYLLISSDRDLFLWEANTAAEQQLYLKEFRFRFTASVPPGQEKSRPWTQRLPIQLQTRGFRPAGTEYRFPIDPKIKDAKYIYNTLYAPSVILERPRDFQIRGSYIYFKDNPFALENLAFRDFGNNHRQLALWMGDVALDHLDLYYNYGYRFSKLTASSEAYKSFLRGLYYFYTHGPQHERVKSALNIICGIPVASGDAEQEIVLSVSGNSLQVTTDQNTYIFDENAPATVTVGQILRPFDSMTDAFEIEDYISNPHWYDNFVIPEYLVPQSPLSFRLSNATTFIPVVGDPGFLVGDTTPDGVQLLTNTIVPQSVHDYSLADAAYFRIQKDRSGVWYPVYLPAAETTGATTLSDMASYLTRASMQLMGNPVNGAGANSYRLLTTATLTLTYAGADYAISVTAAETAAFNSLAEVTALLQTKVNSAVGANKVAVYGYLDANALVFFPKTATVLKLSNLNVSARSELGLFPVSSLIGITIAPYQGIQLSFTSNTIGTTARLQIADMNQTALDALAMRPFRPGSGEFFGTAGDPSPGWVIMDTYLKYNTFRVKYNPAAVHLLEGSLSIQEIIASGRPLYTNAIILPEFEFKDFVHTTDHVITDLDVIPTLVDPEEADVLDRQVYKKASVALGYPQGMFWRQDGVTGDPSRYIYHFSVGATLTLDALSGDGGSLTFTSSEPGLREVDSLIEVTDLTHLKTGDVNSFNSIGVFNRGKAEGGITFPTQSLGTGLLGGIYPADIQAALEGTHWLTGFNKASLYMSATHLLVIDASMKVSFDPFAAGVTAGDFMTLKNFSDHQNNGTFVVLNYFRDVPFLDRKDLSGNPIPVDIIAYRNNNSDMTTQENFVVSHIPLAATASFRSKSSELSKQWLVVLPTSGTIAQRMAILNAVTADDREIFPFEIAYTDGTFNAPGTGTYWNGLTHNGNPDGKETFYGDLYKISWDANPSHEDEEARSLWASDPYSAECFIIGDPQVEIEEFTQALDNTLMQSLTFRGFWNAWTGTPSIPPAAPGNYGDYYFVSVPGTATVGTISSWQDGNWIVSDGTQWLKITDVPSSHPIGYPTPHFGFDDFHIDGTVGGPYWGHETVAVDLDALTPLNHLAGWSLGLDHYGQPLYNSYDYATKVGGALVSYGEVAFWRSVDIHFDQTPPSSDRAEYLGPNGNVIVSQVSSQWPTGDVTVYPSDSFRGYLDASTGRVSSFVTLPKSFTENLSDTVLNELAYSGEWNAASNIPAIPAAAPGNAGSYYRVQTPGSTTIDGHTGWLAGEYLVSNGTAWVYCASPESAGYGLFFSLPTGLSGLLPTPGSAEIGDLYVVTTAGDSVLPNTIADVQAGHQLFELGDWVVFNGTTWVRYRTTSTIAENAQVIASASFQEADWPLVLSADPLLSGASDELTFGARLAPETVTPMIPSVDSLAGVIGAGAAPGDDLSVPVGYVIGGSSLWTGLIGPFEGPNGYVGDWEAAMGYVAILGATAYNGYGSAYLDAHEYQDSTQTHIESSDTFDWSADSEILPTNAIARVYDPGSGYVTIYFQVPEGALDETQGGDGVTLVIVPGSALRPVTTAIELLYFDGTSWGNSPSGAFLSSGAVTTPTFTLKVQDSGDGIHRRLRLWNNYDTSGLFSAESSDIDSGSLTGHTAGKAVLALSFVAPSFTTVSDYVSGVLFSRTILT